MMKKILLSVAVLSTSMVAFAQSNSQSTTKGTDKTEQTACSRDRKDNCKQRDGKKNFFGSKAFDGIDLSAEQKTKLEALREANRSDRQAMKKDESQNDRKNLTDEQRRQMRAERQAKRDAARKSYLEGVKQILTPEQYVQFLENNYMMQQDHGPMMKKDGKKMDQRKEGRRGDKNGKARGPRVDRQS